MVFRSLIWSNIVWFFFVYFKIFLYDLVSFDLNKSKWQDLRIRWKENNFSKNYRKKKAYQANKIDHTSTPNKCKSPTSTTIKVLKKNVDGAFQMRKHRSIYRAQPANPTTFWCKSFFFLNKREHKVVNLLWNSEKDDWIMKSGLEYCHLVK